MYQISAHLEDALAMWPIPKLTLRWLSDDCEYAIVITRRNSISDYSADPRKLSRWGESVRQEPSQVSTASVRGI